MCITATLIDPFSHQPAKPPEALRMSVQAPVMD